MAGSLKFDSSSLLSTTILAYFGIMIIVMVGNSNNDNDSGRFYARDVKVV